MYNKTQKGGDKHELQKTPRGSRETHGVARQDGTLGRGHLERHHLGSDNSSNPQIARLVKTSRGGGFGPLPCEYKINEDGSQGGKHEVFSICGHLRDCVYSDQRNHSQNQEVRTV